MVAQSPQHRFYRTLPGSRGEAMQSLFKTLGEEVTPKGSFDPFWTKLATALRQLNGQPLSHFLMGR
jgi:hypothetical protein